jgi:hypothetical protein
VFRKAIISLFLIGCTAKSTGVTTPDGGVVDPTDSGVDQNGLPAVVESSKSRLQFAGGELYATLLSQGLGIPRDRLCRELGLYDCVEDVHRIALLEVEPYRIAIIDPLENTVVSTPIAVERVALAACTQWSKSFTGDRATAVTTLYQKLLQRDPEEREMQHLEELYASMAAVGDPELDDAWESMSCFAVATTMEALFY